VFTLPPQLAALALQNKKVIYGLLLRASAETLLEVARKPTHLGAEIGFFSVLHTAHQGRASEKALALTGSNPERGKFERFPVTRIRRNHSGQT
jgi:hypothetical protein